MSERRETPDYHCPNCGELAGLLIGPEQAMCGNEKCEAIFFSPNERYTPDDLAAAHRVDLGPLTQLIHETEGETL